MPFSSDALVRHCHKSFQVDLAIANTEREAVEHGERRHLGRRADAADDAAEQDHRNHQRQERAAAGRATISLRGARGERLPVRRRGAQTHTVAIRTRRQRRGRQHAGDEQRAGGDRRRRAEQDQRDARRHRLRHRGRRREHRGALLAARSRARRACGSSAGRSSPCRRPSTRRCTTRCRRRRSSPAAARRAGDRSATATKSTMRPPTSALVHDEAGQHEERQREEDEAARAALRVHHHADHVGGAVAWTHAMPTSAEHEADRHAGGDHRDEQRAEQAVEQRRMRTDQPGAARRTAAWRRARRAADDAIARPGRASSDKPARTTSSAEPTVIGSVIQA